MDPLRHVPDVDDNAHAMLALVMPAGAWGLWSHDLVTREVWWSPELMAVFGLTAADLAHPAPSPHARTHPEDVDAVTRAMEQAIAARGAYAVEFRFRHASGETRWMEGRGRAVCDPSGRPTMLYGVGIDVTERKRAEAARQLQAERRALLLDVSRFVLESPEAGAGLTVAVFERVRAHLDADVCFNYRMVGGEPAMRLVAAVGAPEHHVARARRLAVGESFCGAAAQEGATLMADAARIASDARGAFPRALGVRACVCHPLFDSRGRVLGTLSVGSTRRDAFTVEEAEFLQTICHFLALAWERHEALASLRESEERERAARSEAERVARVKDEFLATLSHELRTPLNAILGWTTLLQRAPGGDAERERGLAVIERNARIQTQLIEELLDMSRVASGKLKLEVEPVHLGQVVEAALDSVRHQAEARGVLLTRSADAPVDPIHGDSRRLQQVVGNLLSNAIKFTPRGGSVHVSVAQEGHLARLTVRDTGQGIPAEFLPHVFGRFRQADASAARTHGGLGLGLAIVKSLVEMHGGTVSVESAGEGEGATFFVSLPVQRASAPDEAAPARAHHASWQPDRLEGVRVLLVDDEPDALELARRTLSESGAAVTAARSGAEALQVLEARRGAFDVLVSDIGMPAFDGYAFIQRVRALPPGAGGAIPAVALTAFTRAEDRRRALAAGYQEHVGKPVEPPDLVATIAKLVGAPP